MRRDAVARSERRLEIAAEVANAGDAVHDEQREHTVRDIDDRDVGDRRGLRPDLRAPHQQAGQQCRSHPHHGCSWLMPSRHGRLQAAAPVPAHANGHPIHQYRAIATHAETPDLLHIAKVDDCAAVNSHNAAGSRILERVQRLPHEV